MRTEVSCVHRREISNRYRESRASFEPPLSLMNHRKGQRRNESQRNNDPG